MFPDPMVSRDDFSAMNASSVGRSRICDTVSLYEGSGEYFVACPPLILFGHKSLALRRVPLLGKVALAKNAL